MNYNIIARLLTDKKDKNGLAPIYLFIYSGSKLILKKSIGQKISPDFWNNETREVEKPYPNSTLINAVISKEINDVRVKILEEKLMKNTVDLPAILQREKGQSMCFFEYSEKQIIQKNYAAETRRAYTVYLAKIKGFKSSLKLSDIDYKFLQEYEAHLRTTLKNDTNTIWGNFKFINTMCNDAVKLKYLTINPFSQYPRPKYKQTAREFLTAKELEKIATFLIEDNADALINVIGNYFLFMAYTGLRYSDAIRFNASHIVNKERIVIETQKTKQTANIYLNDKIRPLAAFVLENKLTTTQEDFNRKLKLIAASCGIKKKVSSHVARHSFGASLVALGVPEKIAQGLLSHGSSASTKIYYHLDSPAMDEAMKKFDT